MKPILIAGSSIVTLALISYSIAFFGIHKLKRLNKSILLFQSIGLILDITATALMIIGSSNGPFTLHGAIGYSSLTLMIFDTVFFWMRKDEASLSKGMTIYSKTAYIWWIIAYITGALIAFLN